MTLMDGVLIIDKPAGLTSHDVVARVRRIVSERRVGHTGTLDPFATGVLVILVGRATRLAQFLSSAEKEYEAVIRFGYATDTGDMTGTPLPNGRGKHQSEGAAQPHRKPPAEEIENAVAALRGEIDQVPPMYSAKKHQGRKLYELARRGEEIERAAVRVNINEFETVTRPAGLLSENEDGTFDLSVRVVCSAGTYIRTLAEDLGRSLSLGAHLVALRRTRAGDFRSREALSLEDLQQQVAQEKLATAMLTTDAALSRLPFVHLTAADAERTRHGVTIDVNITISAPWSNGANVRMRDEGGGLLAVGSFDATSQTLRPRVVLGN
jgi:tRNA pseudouridine55 synthase